MDLKALVNTHRRIAENRQDVGVDYCQKGFMLLAQAELTEFREKQLLKDATSYFIRAIRFKRTSTDAYVGLGYLLILLTDYEGASKYLKEALRLDPSNGDAAKLLEHVQTHQPQSVKPNAQPEDLSDLNYDELYDKIEILIFTQIKTIMETPPMIPTVDTDALKALEQQTAAFETTYQHIVQQLDIIEAEIDTSDLRNNLRPFEIALGRFQTGLSTSHHMQKIQAGILKEMHRVKEHLMQVRNNPESTENEEVFLDDVMDHCDALADELDVLERKAISIEPLLQRYESLVALIEQFRDTLDEHQRQGS